MGDAIGKVSTPQKENRYRNLLKLDLSYTRLRVIFVHDYHAVLTPRHFRRCYC